MYTVNVKRLQRQLRRIQQRLRVDLTPEQPVGEPIGDRFTAGGIYIKRACNICQRPFATRSGLYAHHDEYHTHAPA
jgi:hypothetical protein